MADSERTSKRNGDGCMNYENTYEQEIDLKELLFTILYRWRPIVLAAVIMGLLLGGYKVVSGLRAQQDEETVKEVREQYEMDVTAYERNLASSQWDIEKAKQSLQNQQDYNDASVLMQIDPYRKPRAAADILIKLDAAEWLEYPEGLNMDPTDSLVKLYASNLVQRLDWSKLEKKTGTDAMYLKELVGVGSDYSSNTITIDVVYSDEETADLILDEILAQLEQRKGEFSSIAGSYTASVVNRSLSFIMDTGLADRQKQNTDRVFSFEKDLLDREKALKELEEPEIPEEISKRKVAMQGIKYAVIGGIGGVFLVAFYFCMIYVLSGKLHTDDELKDRFNIKILGVFALPVKKGVLCGIDHWLERLEGKSVRPLEEDVLDRIIINVKNYAGETKKLLFTGTISENLLKELADKLAPQLPEIQLMVCPDMNQNADTLRCLAECEAVILVEKREVSKCRLIQKEKESIDALDKPILGCVII